jgi:hypothetical protein
MVNLSGGAIEHGDRSSCALASSLEVFVERPAEAAEAGSAAGAGATGVDRAAP